MSERRGRRPGKARLLLVEDEEDILELMAYNLTREGYAVATASTGEKGYEAALSQKPDLVLLDLMLPGMDGLEVARLLKRHEETRSLPIIMVTARGEEADIVAGLELGADDYVVKPFTPRVLLARVRAVLRRRAEAGREREGSALLRGDLSIDPDRRTVTVKGKTMELTFTEFNILHHLARRPGWVFTRDQILDAARGQDIHVTDRSVDVHIMGLRKKLGDVGDLIETVRGVGYRFRETP